MRVPSFLPLVSIHCLLQLLLACSRLAYALVLLCSFLASFTALNSQLRLRCNMLGCTL
jgi:hypothetical protein